MQRLRTVWDEIIGLFVDDQLFAVTILIWIVLIWLVTRIGLTPVWAAVALFAGLALILVESTRRAARR